MTANATGGTVGEEAYHKWNEMDGWIICMGSICMLYDLFSIARQPAVFLAILTIRSLGPGLEGPAALLYNLVDYDLASQSRALCEEIQFVDVRWNDALFEVAGHLSRNVLTILFFHTTRKSFMWRAAVTAIIFPKEFSTLCSTFLLLVYL